MCIIHLIVYTIKRITADDRKRNNHINVVLVTVPYCIVSQPSGDSGRDICTARLRVRCGPLNRNDNYFILLQRPLSQFSLDIASAVTGAGKGRRPPPPPPPGRIFRNRCTRDWLGVKRSASVQCDPRAGTVVSRARRTAAAAVAGRPGRRERVETTTGAENQ